MEHHIVDSNLGRPHRGRVDHIVDKRPIPIGHLIPSMLVDWQRAFPQSAPTLRDQFNEALALSHNWDDLQARLAARGYYIQKSGEDIVLFSQADQTYLCPTSKLGYDEKALMRRFKGPLSFASSETVSAPAIADTDKISHG